MSLVLSLTVMFLFVTHSLLSVTWRLERDVSSVLLLCVDLIQLDAVCLPLNDVVGLFQLDAVCVLLFVAATPVPVAFCDMEVYNCRVRSAESSENCAVCAFSAARRRCFSTILKGTR